MDWFETAMGADLFDQGEQPEERHLIICILTDKKAGESRINEFLFSFQKQLNEVSAKNQILFRKTFVYGDSRVCIREIPISAVQEVYYMDICAEPVPGSHIMIIADSLIEQAADAASVCLVLVRESAYGIERADEMILKGYYENDRIPCNLVLAGYPIQEDWLEHFVREQCGKVFSFEEVEKMTEYIWS